MGLDFRLAGKGRGLHAPRWSYGGFHLFRQRLADTLGIHLRAMQGYSQAPDAKPWDGVESDLLPLLLHSDCDGDMSPEDCARVAPALEAIVSQWGDVDYDGRSGMALVAMMKEAAALGVALEFC
jgi:hypothetical protein